jgi:diguanylate cyclase (GGDEF)-like protein
VSFVVVQRLRTRSPDSAQATIIEAIVNSARSVAYTSWSLSNTAFRAFITLAIPAAVLAATQVLIANGPTLPASLSGLKVYGPYAALMLTGAISAWFNRGRAFLALLCIAVAYLAYRTLIVGGELEQPAVRTAFTALCMFVPINLALFSVLSERGLFTVFGLRRLLVIAAEVAFTFWLISEGITGFSDWVAEPILDSAWLKASVIPQGALLVMLLSLIVIGARAALLDEPIEAAMAGALAAFAFAAQSSHQPTVFGLFILSGAALLLIGVLQDSYRMAFQDELTGLPSRRTLNERLMGLGRKYTIAMLDVDNFKKFNDTHGHDVGDQVLKMVASQLEDVRRGGRAFRYGGEEFTLVFPGRGIREVMGELEAVRSGIAQHRLALRGPDRPIEETAGRNLRVGHLATRTVAVTISIGVAESSDKMKDPNEVLQAADKALYRAKEKGRNRVSR